MINLIIVDDHLLVQNGLKDMLKDQINLNIQATFIYGKNLLLYLEENEVDIILLDINLPDSNGVQLCKKIMKIYPNIGIIGLTSSNDTNFIRAMMRNGAKSYLLKNTSKQELLEAINMVYAGKSYLPKSLRNKLLDEDMGLSIHNNGAIPKISKREREILNLVAKEHTNNEIADLLFISIKTVETHRRNLLHKFDSRNTAGLIKKAMELGVIS